MKRRDLFTLKTTEEIAPKQDLHPHHLSRTTAGLEPYIPSTDQPWNYSRAAHLLRRTMIGPKDREIRDVISLGLDKTLLQLYIRYLLLKLNTEQYLFLFQWQALLYLKNYSRHLNE